MAQKLYLSYQASSIPVPAYLDQKKMTHRCGFSIAFDHTLIDGRGLTKSNWYFQEHVRVLCTLTIAQDA